MVVDHAAIRTAVGLADQAMLSFLRCTVVTAAQTDAAVLYTGDLNNGQEILSVGLDCRKRQQRRERRIKSISHHSWHTILPLLALVSRAAGTSPQNDAPSPLTAELPAERKEYDITAFTAYCIDRKRATLWMLIGRETRSAR